MNDVLFIRRSLHLRHAAGVELRKARALPPGVERNTTRRRARGLLAWARTEAWLEGQTSLSGSRLASPLSGSRKATAFGA